MENSLYIHIPFCRRKCVYCDFYSVPYDADAARAYADVISNQIEKLGGEYSTVYVGGGTPSALRREEMERLLVSIAPKLAAGAEYTVEANPESMSDALVRLLVRYGVNRMSIGVQSLDDRKLKNLGRLHDAKKARECVRMASGAGISNISIDLIFGVWGESPDGWRREVEEAVKLPVTHISAYSLTYEKGTPLFDAVTNKSIVPLGDGLASEMYETAIDLLGLRGFKQYEISNFAKEGFRCRHNINYWENGPYEGVGASAVRYSAGVRAKNISDLKEYIKRYESGRALAGSTEKLSPIRRARETAAVKIRTRDGIDFRWFRERTGYDLEKISRAAIADLLDKGLIKYKREGDSATGIVLKRRGVLCCDTVSSSLL